MRTIETILPTIVNATNAGNLTWNEWTETGFATSFSKYTFRVWEWTDENDGSMGLTAHLVVQGHIVDSIVTSEFNSKYPVLSEVFQAARRSFHDVDGVIEDVQDELAKLMKK